jgi:enamine deaminase RidA (YjgF/YER057c/UK114 family)
VFVSGALPVQEARLAQKGLVGTDVALVDKARNSAKQAVVCALAMLREELGGSLNTVKQVVKLNGFVACAPDFHDFDRLFDSASHLLHDLFGSAGRHARSLVGVSSLPKAAPVMVDLVVALK